MPESFPAMRVTLMSRRVEFGRVDHRRRGMRVSCAAALLIGLLGCATGRAAHLAQGFRIGEVRQHSAIVWTRITRTAKRNQNGIREPKKRAPRQNRFVPSTINVNDRQGMVPGMVGQVRVLYHAADGQSEHQRTPWATVGRDGDFIHQFRLHGLKPATLYELTVEARDTADAPVSARHRGSLTTPAEKNRWQDVSFGVVTGQSYWDLDHPDGFEIYPAMRKRHLSFLVPTGDTVYLDSESPRARTVELARYHWTRMYSLPRLVEFHRHVPGYWEKDDHDCWCDDCWPTKSARWMNPLTFAQGAAVFREQVPIGARTFRTIRWGRGLQIWLVEGRDFRSSNRAPDGPQKTIWGTKQRDWLLRSIRASDADFRVLISPTPIVGPDRSSKADNHSNRAFAYEGNLFRNWTKRNHLKNFYVCCGDRHWQYMSIDPRTGLREFSCGPASDRHAGGSPPRDRAVQPFHRVRGGFLTVSVTKANGLPTIAFRHHTVRGDVVHTYRAVASRH